MGEGTTQLVPLPPPSDGEVERMAGVLARRVLSALRATRILGLRRENPVCSALDYPCSAWLRRSPHHRLDQARSARVQSLPLRT